MMTDEGASGCLTELLIGNSAVMRTLHERARGMMSGTHPVLIEGERGVGKERLARAMHLCSHRGTTAFVRLDCAAGADLAAFDTLMGQGASSGCSDQTPPFTLFLDDIGNLDAGHQRTLQVYSERAVAYQVWVVCASAVPLRLKVNAGLFRSDLYETLIATRLFVPPLRRRRVDIPVLAFWFLKRYAATCGVRVTPFSNQLMELFLQADWPDNVRELENTVQRYVLGASEQEMLTEIRERIIAELWNTPERPSLKALRREAVRDCDDKALLLTLNRTNWNRRRAAQELQISYRSLLKTMKDLGFPAKRGPLPLVSSSGHDARAQAH